MSVAKCLGVDDINAPNMRELRAEWPQWRQMSSALPDVDDLMDLPRWMQDAEPSRPDEVLAALRRIAEGDRRAYVALTWLLMPGAARIAGRISRLADEIDQVVAGQLWVQICEHDPGDDRYVAKRILDRVYRESMAELGVGDLAKRRDETWAMTVLVDTFDGVESKEVLADLLQAGIDSGKLTERGRVGETTPVAKSRAPGTVPSKEDLGRRHRRRSSTGAPRRRVLPRSGWSSAMTEFTTNDQWRSFQTYVAAYLVGMLHPRDVLTISRRNNVSPPLAELRCHAAGHVWFSVGGGPWSDLADSERATTEVLRTGADDFAKQLVHVLRDAANVAAPSDLSLCGSGPASSVSVLAQGGFANGDSLERAPADALRARMAAEIDVDGDAIEAAARGVGNHVYSSTKNGSIAAIACAAELARLRNWIDPFSPTPQTGYLVGHRAPDGVNDGDQTI